MIKINIFYGTLFNNMSWQTKSFKDETSAIEWCIKHYEKIGNINGYATGFKPMRHFDIMHAIKNPDM